MSVVDNHRDERALARAATPVNPRLTIADLSSSDLTMEQLESFVPETRAEVRARNEALSRLTAPPVTTKQARRAAKAAARTASAMPAPLFSTSTAPIRTRAQFTTLRAGFTRPRQAVALLAATGVICAAQATAAASGNSLLSATATASDQGSADQALNATAALLDAPRTSALGLETASRSTVRESLTEVTSTPAPNAPALDAPAADEAAAEALQTATEQVERRADATQAVVNAKAAAEAEAARIAAEEAAAAEAARIAAEEAARFKLVNPVNALVISGFGNRTHPVFGGTRMHTGLDYRVGCGVPVGAAEDGKVVSSGWAGGYGNQVIIDHGMQNGSNIKTSYNHLSARTLSVGQVVSKGQQVGLVGTTGTSTGCHLHFEVEQNNTKVNPANFLN